ncbi:MAG: hypothetical protein AAFO91_16425, partial [Bacteroidota bacterium]
MNNTHKLLLAGVAVAVIAGFLLLSNKGEEEVDLATIEREAVVLEKVSETKFGDFNITTSVSARKVEIGETFTVNFSVTDMTPDMINAIASGDPAEYERYKQPWTMDGVIEVDGPANPGEVFFYADNAGQPTDPEDVPYGSAFSRSGAFTCTDKGFVHVDLDYIVERELEDGIPPINPTIDKPAAAEEYLYLGVVQCVEKKKKKNPPQPEMVQVPPPFLVICTDGSSVSGHPLYDIETIEPIFD